MSNERYSVKWEKFRRTKVQPTSSESNAHPLTQTPGHQTLKSGFPQSHLLTCWLLQKPYIHNLFHCDQNFSPKSALEGSTNTTVWATAHFCLLGGPTERWPGGKPWVTKPPHSLPLCLQVTQTEPKPTFPSHSKCAFLWKHQIVTNKNNCWESRTTLDLLVYSLIWPTASFLSNTCYR